MRKINFLQGNSVFAEEKSGVDWYYFKLIEKLLLDKNLEIIIFSFLIRGFHKKILKIKNKEIKFESRYKFFPMKYLKNKIISYFFFKKNEIYIFDAFYPCCSKGKKIFIIHDLMTRIYPENYDAKDLKKQYEFQNNCEKADKIITVSESTKNDIIKFLNIDEKKISVVSPGINLEEYEKKIDTKKLLNYKLPEKYILCLSNYRKNKNLERMIKAYNLYIKKTNNLDIKLVLVGQLKKDNVDIIRLIKELNLENQIILTGYITEKQKVDIYKKASLFLFCSLYEGFGIPLLEAMASGIPIVTSNTSSMPEVVQDAGILVNPLNEVEIYKGIERVLSDKELKQQLTKQGYNIVKRFTWENSAKKFKQIIEEI